jgi:hypothetical protein
MEKWERANRGGVYRNRMGIRFYCPNGHKLNVKAFQAGKKGICPYCGAKFPIPDASTRKSSKEERAALRALAAASSLPHSVSQNFSTGALGSLPVSQSGKFPPSTSPPIVKSTSSREDSISGENKSIPLATDSSARQASDPFADASDIVWYVRPPTGGQYGPATATIMRQWLSEGRISPDSLVWREGWRDWQQASAVFAQLRFSDPMAAIAQTDEQFARPMSVMVKQTSGRSKFRNMPLLICLIIISLIILVCLVVLAISSISNSAAGGATISTQRHELRETIGYNSFL